MNNFGFTAVINDDVCKPGNISYNSCLRNGSTVCYEHFVDKFSEDKVFMEDDSYMLLLDGVIFNKKQILKDFSGGLFACLIDGYMRKGDVFFNGLRGSFCGF